MAELPRLSDPEYTDLKARTVAACERRPKSEAERVETLDLIDATLDEAGRRMDAIKRKFRGRQMPELPRQSSRYPFEQLRQGEPGGTARPIAEPRVITGSWPELERLADATDRVIAHLERVVGQMERQTFGRGEV